MGSDKWKAPAKLTMAPPKAPPGAHAQRQPRIALAASGYEYAWRVVTRLRRHQKATGRQRQSGEWRPGRATPPERQLSSTGSASRADPAAAPLSGADRDEADAGYRRARPPEYLVAGFGTPVTPADSAASGMPAGTARGTPGHRLTAGKAAMGRSPREHHPSWPRLSASLLS